MILPSGFLKKLFFGLSFFVLVISLLPGIIPAEVVIPVLKSPVTDLSNTLGSAEIQALRGEIDGFEAKTSTQIVVLIIPTLEGEQLENYSLMVCEKNKIGSKGKNNGVFLLVAMQERKIRFEIGYGLEGVLTDALTGKIIRNEITPNFKQGAYATGIFAAVTAVMQAAQGEYIADKKSSKDKGKTLSFGVIIVLIIISFVFRSIFGSRRHHQISSRGHNSGIWWGGGGFGGGSGFGGGGGGGWSGGGGSFGGGGASGSW